MDGLGRPIILRATTSDRRQSLNPRTSIAQTKGGRRSASHLSDSPNPLSYNRPRRHLANDENATDVLAA